MPAQFLPLIFLSLLTYIQPAVILDHILCIVLKYLAYTYILGWIWLNIGLNVQHLSWSATTVSCWLLVYTLITEAAPGLMAGRRGVRRSTHVAAAAAAAGVKVDANFVDRSSGLGEVRFVGVCWTHVAGVECWWMPITAIYRPLLSHLTALYPLPT